jgi:hypothetical protein
MVMLSEASSVLVEMAIYSRCSEMWRVESGELRVANPHFWTFWEN